MTGWRPGDRRPDRASMLRVNQAGVDPSRAIFAGLVDPQHRGAVDDSVAGTRHFRALHTSQEMTIAEPSERIAFQPAIEMPRKAN